MLSLILISTAICYFCGLGVFNAKDQNKKRLYLVLSIVSNLVILITFKYLNFFVDSFVAFLKIFHCKINFIPWDIILPLGISFYTFQALSYTIDIYRGKIAPTRNIIDLGLFHTFFPLLIAGPIERAVDLLPQIQKERRFKDIHFKEAVYLFIYGWFLKVVMADGAASMVNEIFKISHPTGAQALLGAYLFALQIYGDFAGYSLMAKGLANFFGIRLVFNFNLPYLSKDPSGFWNRWHISLSSWVRDYLYIPLGGNKWTFLGVVPLAITMFIMGLWHGAAWTFVWWGIYWFVMIYIYRLKDQYLDLSPFIKSHFIQRLVSIFSIFIMFHVTCFSWIIFRSKDMNQVKAFTQGLLQGIDFQALLSWGYFRLYMLLIFLIIYELMQYFAKDQIFLLKKGYYSQMLFFVVLLFFLMIKGPIETNTFIYFQF